MVRKIISSNRLAYLDALRGFAALYVVIYHLSLVPKPSPQVPDWMAIFVGFGGSGVILFFVISGFSMCLTWVRHEATGAPFRSFYISRLFRIAPLFYLLLILTMLRDFVFKGKLGLHFPSEIVANVFFLFNLYKPFQTGIVWASWTIGVEMIFYAIFPIIINNIRGRLSRSFGLLATSILIVLLIHKSFNSESLWYAMTSGVGFLVLLPTFLFGVTAFYTHKWIESNVNKNLYLSLSLFLSTLSVTGIVFIIMFRPLQELSYNLTAVCYCGFLLSFSLFKSNPLVNSNTEYIGRISYSLYLNHPNLIYVLTPIYTLIYQSGSNITLKFTLCIIVTLVILLPLSNLSYKYIEKPFIRYGKNFLKNLVL